jgi:hypothetical protein
VVEGQIENTEGWETMTVRLDDDVDGLVDVTGESEVWIAFIFWSDFDNWDGDHFGAWVDDVVLQVR